MFVLFVNCGSVIQETRTVPVEGPVGPDGLREVSVDTPHGIPSNEIIITFESPEDTVSFRNIDVECCVVIGRLSNIVSLSEMHHPFSVMEIDQLQNNVCVFGAIFKSAHR